MGTYRTGYVEFLQPLTRADSNTLVRHAPPSRGPENKNVRLKFRTQHSFFSNPHHNPFNSEKWSSRSLVSSQFSPDVYDIQTSSLDASLAAFGRKEIEIAEVKLYRSAGCGP
jgi:hypothetical protein